MTTDGPNNLLSAIADLGIDMGDFGAARTSVLRECLGCAVMVARTAPLGLCPACLVAEVEAQREDTFARIVPEIHRGAKFGADLAAWCKDTTAARWAQAVGEKAPPCPTVTFWGTTGGGKSTLAAATLRALLAGARRHASIAWFDARDLALARREHRLGKGEPPELEAAICADVAVIDELGKETLSKDGSPEDVVRVLDERHRRRAGRLTIVTTEWAARADAPGVKLADIYMPSLVRRLTEPWRAGPPAVGSAVVIHVRRGDELKAAA